MRGAAELEVLERSAGGGSLEQVARERRREGRAQAACAKVEQLARAMLQQAKQSASANVTEPRIRVELQGAWFHQAAREHLRREQPQPQIRQVHRMRQPLLCGAKGILSPLLCQPDNFRVVAAGAVGGGLDACVAAARDVERADEAVGEDVRVRRRLDK